MVWQLKLTLTALAAFVIIFALSLWPGTDEYREETVHKAFAELNNAVLAENREAIAAFFEKHVATDAKIELTLVYGVLGQLGKEDYKPRKYDRPMFLALVKERLEGFKKFGGTFQLFSFEPVADGAKNTYKGRVYGNHWVDGAMRSQLGTSFRNIANTSCDIIFTFPDDDTTERFVLQQAQCLVKNRMSSKNGVEGIEDMKKTLQRHRM